jgi:hypothetical protein
MVGYGKFANTQAFFQKKVLTNGFCGDILCAELNITKITTMMKTVGA